MHFEANYLPKKKVFPGPISGWPPFENNHHPLFRISQLFRLAPAMEIARVGCQHRIQLVVGEKQVVGIGDGVHQMSQASLKGSPTPSGGLWG